MNYKKVLKIIEENIGLLLIIFVSILLRLLPHLPNFAPIGGLALFAGANVKGKKGLFILFSTLFVSDLFLGFYKELPFVYGSFLLAFIIGTFLKKHQKAPYLIGASLVSSTLFFIITNFAVWAMSGWYAKTMMGLLNCFVLALPFFRNTLLGDMFYAFSFFYGYRYVSTYVKNKNLGFHLGSPEKSGPPR